MAAKVDVPNWRSLSSLSRQLSIPRETSKKSAAKIKGDPSNGKSKDIKSSEKTEVKEEDDGPDTTKLKKQVDKDLEEYTKRKIQTKTLDLIGRTGGVYIPPYKLAELQKKVTDIESPEYQRQTWEALRKSINGLVNKVNISNISFVVRELFKENLNRGRGLVCRSIIRAQMASPGFTHIYACLCAILNSKLPEIGDLLLRRILLQFRRAYRRNDKLVCKACMSFFAHLINQRMVHELLALQIAMLLLEKLTDDSVELCIDFLQQVGLTLQEVVPQAFRAIVDRLRSIAQEGNVDQRVQYMIEGCQKVIATKFVEFPSVIPELDLLEEDDKITHEIDLLDTNVQGDEMMNIFKPIDPKEFLQNEADWKVISAQILGEENEEAEESDATSVNSEDEEEIEPDKTSTGGVIIKDLTERDIVMLRKTIYLTIMSSANFEECLHKILKMNIKEGHEIHVCTMFIDCNAMERTYQPFFALQAERLCRINQVYQTCFLECFEKQYFTIHHLETNKIRSTAKFFAHLLYKDAIPWSCLEKIHLTEETTTSASRIFIKVLFQELAEQMGHSNFYKKLEDPLVAEHLKGIFPTDSFRHVRFSINFFTAISLGEATKKLREFLASAQNEEFESSDDSSDSSNSSSDDESSSDSSSESSSDSSNKSEDKRSLKRSSVASKTPSDSLSEAPSSDDEEASVKSEKSLFKSESHKFLRRNSKEASPRRRYRQTYRRTSSRSPMIRNRPFSIKRRRSRSNSRRKN